jgi:TM2 domain-containing membrane protein YozV
MDTDTRQPPVADAAGEDRPPSRYYETIEGAERRVPAGLLAIVPALIGLPGLHKFLLERPMAGAAMLVSALLCWLLGFFTFGVAWLFGVVICLISIFEGAKCLTMRDAEFVETYRKQAEEH